MLRAQLIRVRSVVQFYPGPPGLPESSRASWEVVFANFPSALFSVGISTSWSSVNRLSFVASSPLPATLEETHIFTGPVFGGGQVNCSRLRYFFGDVPQAIPRAVRCDHIADTEYEMTLAAVPLDQPVYRAPKLLRRRAGGTEQS